MLQNYIEIGDISWHEVDSDDDLIVKWIWKNNFFKTSLSDAIQIIKLSQMHVQESTRKFLLDQLIIINNN